MMRKLRLRVRELLPRYAPYAFYADIRYLARYARLRFARRFIFVLPVYVMLSLFDAIRFMMPRMAAVLTRR